MGARGYDSGTYTLSHDPWLPKGGCASRPRKSGSLIADQVRQRIALRRQLVGLYTAFNNCDIDRVLAAMADDVEWPNEWEGGCLLGHDAVRSYWSRLWEQARVTVIPTYIAADHDGAARARVRQLVRSPEGVVYGRSLVAHVYCFEGSFVQSMHVAS